MTKTFGHVNYGIVNGLNPGDIYNDVEWHNPFILFIYLFHLFI